MGMYMYMYIYTTCCSSEDIAPPTPLPPPLPPHVFIYLSISKYLSIYVSIYPSIHPFMYMHMHIIYTCILPAAGVKKLHRRWHRFRCRFPLRRCKRRRCRSRGRPPRHHLFRRHARLIIMGKFRGALGA